MVILASKEIKLTSPARRSGLDVDDPDEAQMTGAADVAASQAKSKVLSQVADLSIKLSGFWDTGCLDCIHV